MSKHAYIEKQCEICGKTITTRKDKPSKTCSVECRAILGKRSANLYRKCKECGLEFIAKKQPNEFCSNKCAAKHRSKDKVQIIKCLNCGSEIKKPNCHIKEHNFCSKKCMNEYVVKAGLRAAANHPNWNGGNHYQDGYLFKRVAKGSYRGEHRIIVEDVLGRELTNEEIIHHADGNKLNNSPDNLKVVTRAEHIEIHRDCLYKTRRASHSEAVQRGKYTREVFVD